MKTDKKIKAIELYRDGKEPSEIISLLDISSASFYRWKKEAEENGEFEEHSDPLPPEHELIDYNVDDENIQTLLVGKKRRALKTFKKFFKKLRLNVVGCRWSQDDLEEQISEMYAIQDTIEEILKFDKDKFEDNALWRSLQIFIERFEYLRPIGRQSVDLVFDYEDNRLDEIDKIIAIDDFDWEFDWGYHETIEFERKKSQVLNSILHYEDNSLKTESANQLIEDLEGLELTMEGLNGTYDEDLADLLESLKEDLIELVAEFEEAIFFKSGTLNIPDEVKERIKKNSAVTINQTV